MAKFISVKPINSRWRNQDFVGGANSTHTIPDAMYDEFTADWAYKISIGDIVVTETPTTGNIQVATLTVGDIVLTGTATGNFGGGGGASTTVIGTSPISVSTSSNTATVSLTASYSSSTHDHAGVYQVAGSYSSSTHDHSGTYQPAGTYVNAVVGTSPATVNTASGTATISLSAGTASDGWVLTSDGAGNVAFEALPAAQSGGVQSVTGTAPISATGTTAVTISIDTSSFTTAETLRAYVKNSSGSTIDKGSVVYITGSDGTNATIGLSTASTEAGSSKTLGILSSTLTNNGFGYVIENGQISGIDTSAASAGSSVWLGTTPGSFVFNAPPAEPNHSVYLGVVTKANASTGEILVKVQNGYELDEIHDVSVGSPSDLDIIQYKSSSGLWTKASFANAGIAASSHTHAYETSGAVSSHEAAADPHIGYLLETAASSTYATTGHNHTGTYAAEIHSHAQTDVTNLTTDLSTINTAVTSAQTTANTANTTANNAVPKSTVTTKGDLIVASAASAVARLGVGTDGQILTARSTATNGVAWETAAAGGGSTTITFNTVTTAYTLALTDKDKMVQSTSATALNITCPANSTTAFATGDQIHLLQAGAGQVTIVAATGVTINATYGLKLRAQWSSATLIKRDTNTWVLIGDTVV